MLTTLVVCLYLEADVNGATTTPTRSLTSSLARQPFADPRAPIERVIRRHQQSSSSLPSSSSAQANGQLPYVVLMEPNAATNAAVAGAVHAHVASTIGATFAAGLAQQAASRYLLNRYKRSSSRINSNPVVAHRCNESTTSENEQQQTEVHKADKSMFVQELLLTTLTELSLSDKDSLGGNAGSDGAAATAGDDGAAVTAATVEPEAVASTS